MSFTATITARIPGTGSRMRVYGTYTNSGGSTGGDVTTNLQIVEGFSIHPGGAAILASTPVINETFPLMNSGGAVTIVNNANETGYWQAWGV